MKRRMPLFMATGFVFLTLGFALRADDTKQLSPERLDELDQLGYFTPAFKQAVRDYVSAKDALKDTKADQAKLELELPGLRQQASESQVKADALRQELAKYEHPEENDFTLLQAKMADHGAKPEEQLALAQAYVWTYPASPHASDAQQDLEQVKKKLADQLQAQKDADAARAAAHADLVRRAKARDLTLPEWRDFLRGMSQTELVNLIGHPTSQIDDYWIYSGDWSVNPSSKRKAGLQINFDAGRVLTVDEKPASP
jgi:hypothetical protein